MNRHILIFLIFTSTYAAQVEAIDTHWEKDLTELNDNEFIGALSPTDVALAERIAADLSLKLGSSGIFCDRVDPGSGTIVGSLNKNSDQTPEAFLPQVLPILRPLATRIGMRKRQSAVIMLSLNKIGPKANSILPLLDWWTRHDQPWATTAIESISCQKYSSITLEKFSKTLKIDYGMDLDSCLPEYLPRIFELGLNKEMIWPEGTIEGTISGGATNCESVDIPPELSTTTLEKIETILGDTEVAESRKHEVLRIIENSWPTSARRFGKLLSKLRQSSDKDFQFTAERLIVTLGTKESADIFNFWITNDYNTWIWPSYVKYLHGQKSAILPTIVKQLDSSWWNQRTAAANAIAELGADSSANDLIKAIRPDDWVLTEAIVKGLGSIAANNLQAKEALTNISEIYWSPKIRKQADELLTPMAKPAEIEKNDQIKELEYVGFSNVDHGLQTCKISETPLWNFPDGTKRKLDWKTANRNPLPRGEFKDVSSWCANVGDFTVLAQKEGWLVGCMGFELDGGVAWLPKIKSKPIEKIARITVNSIFEFQGEIYLSGYNFFMGASRDAGQLFRLKHDGSKWDLEPVMLLPSLTDAVAITDDYMVFDDAHSTVAVDGTHNIYPLTCDK